MTLPVRLLFLLLFAPRLFAATYYVSVSGTDTNPGTLTQPWRTIQKAANSLTPGDQALVRSGTYNERVTVNASGSATGGPVTFQNYPGETPIVDGTGLAVPAADTGLFLIADKSYVVINGFEIRNYKTTTKDLVPVGIHVTGACSHVEIRNNRIHHVENNATPRADKSGCDALGIAVYGTSQTGSINNLVIDGNEVFNLKTGSSESIALDGNVEQFQVSNNRIHDNNNIGIDFAGFYGVCPSVALDQARNGLCISNTVYNISSYGNPAYGNVYAADGIYVDGGTGIVIERNTVYGCDIGIEVSSEIAGHYASAITTRDNFIHHCLIGGIFTGGYDTSVGWAQNCSFLNNSLYQNDTLAQGNGEICFQNKVTNCTFKNNILYAGSQNLLIGNPFSLNSGNVVDYNLFFAPGGTSGSDWEWKKSTKTGFVTYKTATGNDAHSVFADPKYVTAATVPDLHLQLNSPAIDAGDPAFTPASGETDFDGTLRVTGTRVDVGADELAPVDAWRILKFGTNAINPAIAGDTANPVGDGLPNLLKYALGLDPTKSGTVPVGMIANENNYLTLTATKNSGAVDVSFSAESTGDLATPGSWSTQTTTILLNNTNTFKARDTVPADSALQRFIRLKITHP